MKMPGKNSGFSRLVARFSYILTILAAALCLSSGAAPARASSLDRAALEILFPKPFTVGERDATLPVWPIFTQSYNGDVLVAYAFESIDFEPIPGFSGTPVNLLVAIKPSGELLDVRVLSQHEPVFVDGLGPEPLKDFVRQYLGKSLRQSIKIVAPGTRNPRQESVAAEIDGVAKATASVRIINETIVNSALQVARARLGFSRGRDPNRAAHVKPDAFEPLSIAQMLDRGLIRHLRLSNGEIEKAFAGTIAECFD
jgi:transcriptional regulator of nitric oxide reductase